MKEIRKLRVVIKMGFWTSVTRCARQHVVCKSL